MYELISVIIPIYNADKYLIQCLDSVLNQTYSNIEVIVVNDGSTDKTGDICSKYEKKDSRISVIHKQKGGAAAARNAGLDIARGTFIGFVDSDDYIEPNFYQTLYEMIKLSNSDVSMVSYNQIKNKLSIPWANSNEIYLLEREEAIIQLLLDKKIQNYVWNKLYKREIFIGIRFPQSVIYDDINIMYRIMNKINYICCKDIPLYNYVYRDDSVINANNHQKFVDELISIINRYDEIYIEHPNLQKYNSYSLILWATRLVTYMAIENDFDDQFFREKLPLLKLVFEKNKHYIINNISYKKCIILLAMLLDLDKARLVAKIMS
ncbi:MAG: glycosyltransferase [Coxiellaceae bacterium]|jgi:glycosyltransferase involved in cell wall biosynthesis|nr:glycosyltransferase [Coxiellaceae bacterium]